MADFFSPGEVAERTGFSLDTLRCYERISQLSRQREQIRQKIGWYGEHLAARETTQATPR